MSAQAGLKRRIAPTIFTRVWWILLPRERTRAVYLMVLMSIGMLLEMLGVGIIVPVMTALTNPAMLADYPGGADFQRLFVEYGQATVAMAVLAGLVGLYAVKTAFLAYLAWKQADFVYGMQSSVSRRLFKSYLGQPYPFHLANNSSSLVRNTVTEPQVFALFIVSPALSFLAEMFVLVGITVLLFYLQPVGSLIAMVGVGGVALAFHRLAKTWSSRFGNLRQEHEGARIKVLQEGLLAVKEVILLNRARNFLDRYDRHADISAVSAGRQSLIGQLPRLVLEFIVVLGCSGLFAWQLYNQRSIEETLPLLVLFGAAAFRLMPSVNRMLIAINSLQYGLPVLDVLHAQLATEASALSTSQPATPSGTDQGIDGPIRTFELRDVSFRYDSAQDNALSGIALRIRAGEMLGIIGPSGAGKSSLIDVFLGLLPPNAGEVLVNDAPINVVSNDWKARIGYVPQTIVLLDDTIRRNVAFGLDDALIDEAKVMAAIRAAQLEDYLAELPDGLGSVVGEHGVRMSGGQRQRIGLARALYGNPEILVLDEATSALDTDTENEVMGAIRGMHGKKTILIIAHRLSTLRECDRILRLAKGRVEQEGTPAEMIDGDAALAPATADGLPEH